MYIKYGHYVQMHKEKLKKYLQNCLICPIISLVAREICDFIMYGTDSL